MYYILFDFVTFSFNRNFLSFTSYHNIVILNIMGTQASK